LPIVEFQLDEKQPLSVHYAALEALRAAQDRPQDDFFDLRGKLLTLVVDDDGTPRLVAGRRGNEVELRRRILAVLRRTAELHAGDGPIGKDVEALLAWLGAAPSVDFLVHALGLAETEDLPTAGKSCKRCSPIQMWFWGTPKCCPG